MASPFIIEKVYGFTPVMTGYSSLASGIALMSGGIISKLLIKKNLFLKINTAIFLQIAIAVLMLAFTSKYNGLAFLLAFTLSLHLLSGFIFNNVYAYSLQRFTANAGIASGLTGGGVYVVSSAIGYGLINVFDIKNIQTLSIVNVLLVSLLFISVLLFKRAAFKGREIPEHLIKVDV